MKHSKFKAKQHLEAKARRNKILKVLIPIIIVAGAAITFWWKPISVALGF